MGLFGKREKPAPFDLVLRVEAVVRGNVMFTLDPEGSPRLWYMGKADHPALAADDSINEIVEKLVFDGTAVVKEIIPSYELERLTVTLEQTDNGPVVVAFGQVNILGSEWEAYKQKGQDGLLFHSRSK